MADNKFDTPKLREYPIIPKLKKGVMSHSKPFIAKEPHQEPLGFPGELVDDWENVAIKKMADLQEGGRGGGADAAAGGGGGGRAG